MELSEFLQCAKHFLSFFYTLVIDVVAVIPLFFFLFISTHNLSLSSSYWLIWSLTCIWC